MKSNEGTLNGVAAMQLMRGVTLEDGPYTLQYGVDGRDVFMLKRHDGDHDLTYEFERVEQTGDDAWELAYGDGRTGGKLFLRELDGYDLLRDGLRTIAKAFDN